MDCLRKEFAATPLVAEGNGPVKNLYLKCGFFCSFNLFKQKTFTLTSVETQTSAWETSPNCRLLKIKEKEKITS